MQVSVVGETVNVTGQSSVTPVKVPSCRLSDELGLLFERAAFSDVTLVVGDRQFQAHKAVLAGNSQGRAKLRYSIRIRIGRPDSIRK